MTPDETRSDIDVYGVDHAIASLANIMTGQTARIEQLEREVRYLTEAVDTLWTPPHKKLLFWLDGWPLYRLASRPAGRPWRRWWRS